ncbi:MAG: 50S ribosomal protein L15 [Candidatus Marinimicrobia bacterium]|nr:50S ribosomal protein L15 [Candidatus Neomarinimicrobiota bacterium]
MKLQAIQKSQGSTHRRKRVGRGEGSGLGKTSGRGHKGQHSRSGSGYRPAFEGGQMSLVRRVAKRGFNHAHGRVLIPVNLADLARLGDVAEITPELLRAQGLAKGVADGIKILARGEITRAVTIKAQAFSAAAQAKIEAAGGRWEVLT